MKNLSNSLKFVGQSALNVVSLILIAPLAPAFLFVMLVSLLAKLRSDPSMLDRVISSGPVESSSVGFRTVVAKCSPDSVFTVA